MHPLDAPKRGSSLAGTAPASGLGGQWLPGVGLARVVGALSVFVYHFVGDATAAGLFRHSVSQSAANVVAGFAASWGVSLFVVVSGLGLALSAGRRPTGVWGFWKDRALRPYPRYWWVALPLLGFALVGGALSVHEFWKLPFWLLGLNFLDARLFFPTVNAWWYVGLAIQMYAVFPALMWISRRAGPLGLVVVSALATTATGAAVHGLALAEYLSHSPVVKQVVRVMSGSALNGLLPAIVVSLAAALGAAVAFEWSFERVSERVPVLSSRVG